MIEYSYIGTANAIRRMDEIIKNTDNSIGHNTTRILYKLKFYLTIHITEILDDVNSSDDFHKPHQISTNFMHYINQSIECIQPVEVRDAVKSLIFKINV